MSKKYKYSFLILLVIVITTIMYIILHINAKNKQTNNEKLYTITSQNEEKKEDNLMLETSKKEKINMNINGKDFLVTLEDNETVFAILEKVPLNIKMDDLNSNEKYYYFTQPLPANPTKQEKINAGDVMLYGEDCLVIFYETFNTNYKYTKIGTVDDIVSLKNEIGKGSIDVSITKEQM